MIPELALDGPEVVTIGLLGYQVDAAIRATMASGPVILESHSGKLLLVERVGLEKRPHQMLKFISLVAGTRRCTLIFF